MHYMCISADLSACERDFHSFFPSILFLPLFLFFMFLQMPYYLAPLRYSLGFRPKFAFQSYIVVVVIVEGKPLPFPGWHPGESGDRSKGGCVLGFAF